MRPVYLDNNATTPVDPEVVAAMLPYFSEKFGNASSSHSMGSEAADAVGEARRSVRRLIGAAHEQEIIFTSGGTEADNAAILSALETQAGRNEVIVSSVEHAAVLSCVQALEKAGRIRLHLIPVDRAGRLDLRAYRAVLSSRTALVSIMWANNETGTLFPIAELGALARDAGALFHTDAVQAAGKVDLSVKDLPVDMLSLSGHKLHGPKGVGVLYLRKGVKFAPLVRGGKQERGRRGGTENVPAIIGLGRAAELAATRIGEMDRPRALRDRLETGLLRTIPDCFVVGDVEHRLPNTCNIAFSGADSEITLLLLDQIGIAASSGSACASGSTEPSHVLRAMRVPYDAIHGAVRFSLSRCNADADIDRVLAAMPEVIARSRAAATLDAEEPASAGAAA